MPVQRVTKYPLLLSRLHKVTPSHHEDKNNIKLAQDKIEAALEQMNNVRGLIGYCLSGVTSFKFVTVSYLKLRLS